MRACLLHVWSFAPGEGEKEVLCFYFSPCSRLVSYFSSVFSLHCFGLYKSTYYVLAPSCPCNGNLAGGVDSVGFPILLRKNVAAFLCALCWQTRQTWTVTIGPRWQLHFAHTITVGREEKRFRFLQATHHHHPPPPPFTPFPSHPLPPPHPHPFSPCQRSAIVLSVCPSDRKEKGQESSNP